MAVEWIEVESSNVAAIAYIRAAEQLLVQFNNGSVYSYSAVPVEVFDGLKAADSKGRYLNAHIKGVYDCQKIS